MRNSSPRPAPRQENKPEIPKGTMTSSLPPRIHHTRTVNEQKVHSPPLQLPFQYGFHCRSCPSDPAVDKGVLLVGTPSQPAAHSVPCQGHCWSLRQQQSALSLKMPHAHSLVCTSDMTPKLPNTWPELRHSGQRADHLRVGFPLFHKGNNGNFLVRLWGCIGAHA